MEISLEISLEELVPPAPKEKRVTQVTLVLLEPQVPLVSLDRMATLVLLDPLERLALLGPPVPLVPLVQLVHLGHQAQAQVLVVVR